jgi:hypothetical protein
MGLIMPKVAVCSKSKHWELWAALRAAGVPIISTWIDWYPNRDEDVEPGSDEWRDHVVNCIDDVIKADVLILYCRADERQFGALLEAGAALAGFKQVFLVAPAEWPFLRNHPRVRSFKTLEDAVAAIAAMMKGEHLRAVSAC